MSPLLGLDISNERYDMIVRYLLGKDRNENIFRDINTIKIFVKYIKIFNLIFFDNDKDKDKKFNKNL